MDSLASEKSHAVCVPYPAQGHMTPMLMLAKLLHTRGFHITFVVTEFNYRRLVRSQGLESVKGLPDFQFATIPDGLPYSDEDATQNISDLCISTMTNCLGPFLSLLAKLNDDGASSGIPPVSSIVSDCCMTFTLDAARQLRLPLILLWTASACGFLAYLQYQLLVDRDLLPLKEVPDLKNRSLEVEVGSIPGLTKGMLLKDFPSHFLTTDRYEKMLNYIMHEINRVSLASAIVLNTFEDLETLAIDTLKKVLPPIYTVGPLPVMINQGIPSNSPLASISTNLWKEDTSCFEWLDGKASGSVVYVSFGSITMMSNEQLVEFAWGLANSGYPFLWVIRPDLIKGQSNVLPTEFSKESTDRGLVTSWCQQQELLHHPAVGVFLTHSGWNSTLESLSAGVPMICWPFFAEQRINCKYSCTDWGVGMEISNNAKREEVEGLVREMMGGNKGREKKRKAMEWKERITEAIMPLGSSSVNLEKVIKEVFHSKNS